MSQSELINELATALSKAQGEMQAAIKDKLNPFYKSAYADLGSVWDAARPVLSKYGLAVIQTTELISDRNQILLVTTLVHSSGQWIKSHIPLNPSKPDSQGVGAAITYLRRYSLSAIVGVVCDDDDDGEEAVGRGSKQAKTPAVAQNAPPKPIEKVSNDEAEELKNLLTNLDEQSLKGFRVWIHKNFNAGDLTQIPKAAFEQCKVSLNAKIKFLKDQERVVA